jgi:hypothetical protein
MEMIAHDVKAAQGVGIPQGVGKDFVTADKGKNLKKLPMHVGNRGTKATHGYGR